jgi:hypothetical protein
VGRFVFDGAHAPLRDGLATERPAAICSFLCGAVTAHVHRNQTQPEREEK